MLVVDDDHLIHDMVRLSMDGVAVVSAYSVTEALDILAAPASYRLDGALVDVVLPDGSGFVVLAAAQDRGGDAIPVVMMSAHDAPQGLSSATRYVRKPLTPDVVTEALLDLIVD